MTAILAGTRLAARIGCLILVLLAGLILVLLAVPIGRRAMRLGKLVWFKGGLLILNVRVRTTGRPFSALPTLLVANHVSWLDILILGHAADATFVAKSEIAGWPVIGWLARMTGTMFVRRHWRSVRQQRDELAARLEAGQNVVLFPEGTSTDGLGVHPFKSALFAAVEGNAPSRPLAVQPVTLAYVALADGTPIGAEEAGRYAWFGETLFAPHLLAALCSDGCRVDLVLHEPVLSWEVEDRKQLARQAQALIAREVALRRMAAMADDPSGHAEGRTAARPA